MHTGFVQAAPVVAAPLPQHVRDHIHELIRLGHHVEVTQVDGHVFITASQQQLTTTTVEQGEVVR